jgi:hypothetical protein
MSGPAPALERIARRTFIKRLTLGCAGLLGVRAWQSPAPLEQSSARLLARRILRIIGAAVPSALPAVAEPAPEIAHDMAQQLAHLCGVPDCAAALTLEDAQLKQLISKRIQEQYQQGVMVRHHGWWLARSEVVLLQLGTS